MAVGECDREVVRQEDCEPDNGHTLRDEEATGDEKKCAPDHPVDRGWAWVVLGGCVLEIFVYGGIMRSFGVFFLQYQMRFNSNASETAVMSLIQNVFISISALFIMTVGLKKFSSRTAVFVGGILTGVSFLITAFTENIGVFYFAQGALSGVGMALIHPPILSILGVYFKKHRGLANSIFMAGASVGGLVFAPLAVNLFEEYDYTGAMLIVSGLLFNICVAACLMRPTEFYSKHRRTQSIREHAEEMKLIKTSTPDIVPSDADQTSECNHSRLDSSDYSEGSHAPSVYPANHQGSPLLQRVRAHSVDKAQARHRTRSEGHSDRANDLHGSKGRLNNVLEAISRSQRNVYASDGMFGSIINVNEPITKTESTNDDTSDEHNESDESGTNCGCCQSSKKCILSMLRTMFDIHLLRNPVFIAFLLMAFMFIAGVSLAPAYLPPLAKEIGLSNDNIAILLSIISAIDLVSKISVGFIADRGWVKRSTILVIIAFVFGTASHLVVFVKSFPAMIVFAIAMGLCCGQYTSMYAVVLQDVTGPEKFAQSLGFGTLVHGTSIAIFFPIAGHIRDVTNSYVGTFHLFGGLAYMAGILVIVISVINKRKLARDKKKQEEVSLS